MNVIYAGLHLVGQQVEETIPSISLLREDVVAECVINLKISKKRSLVKWSHHGALALLADEDLTSASLERLNYGKDIAFPHDQIFISVNTRLGSGIFSIQNLFSDF